MSDVWQGPGWWLASDGKWYPADAEPGAVYDGDLSEPATEPGAVSVDTIATADPATSIASGTVDTPVEPQAPAPELEVAAAPDAVVENAEASAGAAVFDEMPAPVVEESRGGGWQAIEPEAPAAPAAAAPEPAAPGPTGMFASPTADQVDALEEEDEDGWTSAFEERQTVNDIIGAAPTGPAGSPAPDAGASFLQSTPAAPEAVAPPASPPDMALSTPPAPVAPIPDVTTPAVEVPEVQAPTIAAPDVSVPEVAAPGVSIPGVSTPNLSVPDVSVPDVSVPEVQPPTISAPEVSVPEVQPPTFDTPTVPPPGLTAPDVTAAASPLETTIERPPSEPIERSDAWRKPNEVGTVPRTNSAPTGTPEVVDLAVPQDAPTVHSEPTGSNLRPILYGVGILVAIIALAFLITQLFVGNDDDSGDDSAVATDTTEQDAAELDPATTERSQETTSTEAAAVSPDDTSVSVFDLRAGDCIVGDIGAGQVTEVTKVDCEEEHQFEVYREALIDSSITVFDEDAISAYAEEVCRTSLEAYIPPDDDRGLKFKFLQPTQDSWNQADEPDRVITCLLFDEDAPLVGRAG